jgi:hypothetical protein
MSKNWSKEDRHHFEKSEVMQGLETIVLDTIRRADILQQKIARSKEELEKKALSPGAQQKVNDFNAVADAAEKASEKAGELFGNADDGSVDEACDGGSDHADDETAEDALQDEVVDDLRDLVAAALLDGNIKLAYRIERTIDEILEQDAPCL